MYWLHCKSLLSNSIGFQQPPKLCLKTNKTVTSTPGKTHSAKTIIVTVVLWIIHVAILPGITQQVTDMRASQ